MVAASAAALEWIRKTLGTPSSGLSFWTGTGVTALGVTDCIEFTLAAALKVALALAAFRVVFVLALLALLGLFSLSGDSEAAEHL